MPLFTTVRDLMHVSVQDEFAYPGPHDELLAIPTPPEFSQSDMDEMRVMYALWRTIVI